MIISVSRRTDVPQYFSEWFYNRIKEGFVLTRNPMNFRQVSRVTLTSDAVDGIVFWTKNPLPMLERLRELNNYMYYFLFTLTPYGKDIEPGLPGKTETLLPTFKRLSNMLGPDRVIWRYDPILINAKYTPEYHTRAFTKIANELHKHTNKVILSFIDTGYRGVKSNIHKLALSDFPLDEKIKLAASLAKIAHSYGLSIETCATEMDLQQYGINSTNCIDGELFEKLLGRPLSIKKDKNQRQNCGCISSIDIGMYNSCLTGCRYCYANYNQGVVAANHAKHNPLSPLLLGESESEDKIKNRRS